jgi:hypothetical protein
MREGAPDRVLTVADHAQPLAFYRDALGLAQLEDWSGKDSSFAESAGVSPSSDRDRVARRNAVLSGFPSSSPREGEHE